MRHPVNRKHHQDLTFGERAAETLASRIGSWPFLIIQSCFLAAWIILNIIAIVQHWDPYPFILLNLALSFQAAYTGPVLLIANNRQSAKDRDLAEHTYSVELELKTLIETNTNLTEEVRRLSSEMHEHIVRSSSEGEANAGS